MNRLFLKQGCVARSVVFSLLISASLVSLCHAQDPANSQEPVTQKRMPAREIGDATYSLLEMQARGSFAGPALPMLGATSSLSWERYKDSFKHKIPESFERAVSKSNTGGQ